MKLLVVGGGGREHALVWKLAQSPRVTRLWCAPGNGGISQERLQTNGRPVECVSIRAEDVEGLVAFAQKEKPDLTVVGPEAPLCAGLADRLQALGLRVFGPTQQAARFEASKVFAHQFMQRYGIPCPKGQAFTDVRLASRYAAEMGGRCAVKADGLAAGKGVIVCKDMSQADEAIRRMLERHEFGEAGARILIQERLEGTEVSLHAFCDGQTAVLFPTSQDHKRAFDGDQGPNTGGMGTYSPAPFFSEEQLAVAQKQILDRWLEGCRAEGILYRGILYPGLMLTREGPKVLEFNVRFGDPETQVYMMRLESDLVDLMEAVVEGRLRADQIRWSSQAAVCVVMASGGYPGKYEKGKVIEGLETVAQMPKVKVFHAGTQWQEGRWITSGGRVLGVTAVGDTLQEARDRAYEAVAQIRFEGAFYRKDIGARAL